MSKQQYDSICYVPKELNEQLQKETDILLIDVRSYEEHKIYNLTSILIPLKELPLHLEKLNRNQNIVIYCQSGARSITAVKILLKADFNSVRYLEGGIEEWINLSRLG